MKVKKNMVFLKPWKIQQVKKICIVILKKNAHKPKIIYKTKENYLKKYRTKNNNTQAPDFYLLNHIYIKYGQLENECSMEGVSEFFVNCYSSF